MKLSALAILFIATLSVQTVIASSESIGAYSLEEEPYIPKGATEQDTSDYNSMVKSRFDEMMGAYYEEPSQDLAEDMEFWAYYMEDLAETNRPYASLIRSHVASLKAAARAYRREAHIPAPISYLSRPPTRLDYEDYVSNRTQFNNLMQRSKTSPSRDLLDSMDRVIKNFEGKPAGSPYADLYKEKADRLRKAMAECASLFLGRGPSWDGLGFGARGASSPSGAPRKEKNASSNDAEPEKVEGAKERPDALGEEVALDVLENEYCEVSKGAVTAKVTSKETHKELYENVLRRFRTEKGEWIIEPRARQRMVVEAELSTKKSITLEKNSSQPVVPPSDGDVAVSALRVWFLF